jgi:putative transcriptional regulator
MNVQCRHNRHALPLLRFYTPGMGLRIKDLRKQAGLTQAELGDKAGISRSQLAEIENETAPANTLRLSAIARALDVSVEELFDLNDGQDAYRRLILELMRNMSADDRAHILHIAQALAKRG